ncbi:flagellin, partial [Rheinheimera sp.]
DEMTNIISNTSYGSGTKLLDGTDGKLNASVDFQIGSSAAEVLSVDISTELGDLDTAMTATEFAAGFDSGVPATDQADAKTVMGQVDSVINAIGAARASLGASMNRLDHTINNVTNMKENTEAAAGQLMDADFARETSNMTKQQLLMNSGISVLSASNSTTQMIGSLLR